MEKPEARPRPNILDVCKNIGSLIEQGYKFDKYQEFTQNGVWVTVLKKENAPDQTFELDETFPFSVVGVENPDSEKSTEKNFVAVLSKLQ